MKFYQVIIPVFEDDLRKKKKDQRLERQILFRRPGFLDKVMKNFNTIYGGHFWNEFVGKTSFSCRQILKRLLKEESGLK